jgi:signal transduction histidine kinase
MQQETVPARSRWPWIVAIWGSLGLFDAVQTVIGMHAMGMHHAWASLFVKLFLGWLPWALATPVIIRTGLRHPASDVVRRPFAALAPHAATWSAVMLATNAWCAALTWALNPWTPELPRAPFGQLFAQGLYERLLPSLVLYAFVLVAGHLVDSRARVARQRLDAARLSEALAQAQLEALRHQIEPHFLFNALNAVSGLVREGENARAVEALARISDFLRRVLQESGEQETTLAEELRFATMYLGIQELRFADRLHVRVEIAPGLEHAVVPRLILQPLVENAVKHGISRRAQAGTVAIAAARDEARLVLSVYNDGPSVAANDPGEGTGLGLANVRERLERLHGGAAALAVDNVGTQGVRVSIAMPLREPGQARCRA